MFRNHDISVPPGRKSGAHPDTIFAFIHYALLCLPSKNYLSPHRGCALCIAKPVLVKLKAVRASPRGRPVYDDRGGIA